MGCKETRELWLSISAAPCSCVEQHPMQPQLSPLQMQGNQGHVHHSTWPTVGVLSGLHVRLNAVTN